MLRSLLITRDEPTLRIVARVFKDLEVELDHVSESAAALSHVATSSYDAIVVDDHVKDAHIVFEKLIELSSSNKSVRIVLADPAAVMHPVFKAGTQVILYKPLSADRVRHGLRAVRNLMARERRRGAGRVPTTIPARISPRQAKGAVKQVRIADLSESGAAIHCESGDMPSCGSVNLEFALSDSPELIHATAELVWRDDQGAAGVRFLDMPTEARKRLAQWLKEKAKAKPHAMASRAGAS